MDFRSKEQDAFIADFAKLCKKHKVTLSVYDDYNGVDEFCGTKVQIISKEFVNGTAPIFINDCDLEEFAYEVNGDRHCKDGFKLYSEFASEHDEGEIMENMPNIARNYREQAEEWWENLSNDELREVYIKTGNFRLGGWAHDTGPTIDDVIDMYKEVFNLKF